MAEQQDGFCLREVLAAFRACLTAEQTVLMDPYLCGWNGLIRFLNSLGTIFSFVSKDAVTKIQIMEKYRSSDQQEKYETLQSMVEYELANGLVGLKNRGECPESGCRTILRLHRALHWLQMFLEGLRTSQKDSKTSVICTDSYNASLANYHPWVIRKAATLAFCALPTRNAFLENMNLGTPEEAVDMLGEALPYVCKVYEITEELYAKHKMLDLP
ncbi:PREDICTED: ceramide-1-phosphate transfer protein [Gavialis gangeticus]|uniref:ceramide-1-phosphate transfer protein n=1 Tax=Gavialis gangeticus TaxID=94835 RepID=UPI00092F2395|nr:PREDICTED: ceramide-1-phosphate transfer protein [Gavialis gangeticus]